MERKIIFKDTETGREMVMPVTPPDYEIEHGRRIERLTMHQVGEVTVPGGAVLLNREQEFLLPAHAYPFNQPGANTNPFVYLEQLERWSDAGTVLRYVVAGTPINAPVCLGAIRYREQDGTNNVYVTVPIHGKCNLTAEAVETVDAGTGNAARAAEAAPQTQNTYTVVAGDTLGGIARRFYGDAGLYTKLAAANGIANPSLIRVGQLLKLPEAGQLPAEAAPSRSQQVAAKTKTKWNDGKKLWETQLDKGMVVELGKRIGVGH